MEDVVPIVEFERTYLAKLLSSIGVRNPHELVERFIREREAYCRRLLARLSRLDGQLPPKLVEELACSPNMLDKALSLWLIDRAYRDAHKMLYM